jgi:hypothetical protein
MKRIITSIAAGILICAVSAASVSAKVKSHTSSIGSDFVIAGTTVKAGTYVFRFDEEKNELTVVNRKTKEVVARADARAEAQKKAAGPGVQLAGGAPPQSLIGVSFDGKQLITVSSTTAQTK